MFGLGLRMRISMLLDFSSTDCNRVKTNRIGIFLKKKYKKKLDEIKE